jgi:hypothetical protein
MVEYADSRWVSGSQQVAPQSCVDEVGHREKHTHFFSCLEPYALL